MGNRGGLFFEIKIFISMSEGREGGREERVMRGENWEELYNTGYQHPRIHTHTDIHRHTQTFGHNFE